MLLLLIGFAAAVQDPLPKPDPAVSRVELLHHVQFFASDELKGRAITTPESRRVSDYIARGLERSGVEAGVGKSYFQSVPLLTTAYSAAPTLTLWDGEAPDSPERALTFGAEFTVMVQGDPKDTPTLKVLVVKEETDLPEQADPKLALVMHSSRRKSFSWLEDHGFDGGQGFGLIIRVRPTSKGRTGSVPRDRIERAWKAQPDGPEVATVTGEAADDLWEGRVAQLRLSMNATRRPTPERNVVGILHGVGTEENPGLKDEVIVLSAHFDHVGVIAGKDPALAAEGEDVIRNGADDDASGCAVLLELAEAFGAGPAPARTVIFLFCAAEELGMWGTYYFADNPTVPIESIVCNLNLEMLGMPDDLAGGVGKPWLSGYERTNLGPLFGAEGLAIGPDLRPEQHYFERSDNIVFVKQGIVGQTLSTGGDNPNYHKVSDEVQTLDFEHMELCAQAAWRAAGLLASGTISPSWNEGEPKLTRR